MTDGSAKRKRSFTAMAGFQDVLPGAADAWRAATSVLDRVSDLYQFRFMETPLLEDAELFRQGLGGEGSAHGDLARCRLGSRAAVLRHEGLIPILRSYLENRLGHVASPFRVAYRGPFYTIRGKSVTVRREHGFAIIGEHLPFYDAEVIVALRDALEGLGLKNPTVHINAVGCRVCRPAYEKRLRAYLAERSDELCRRCVSRIDEDPTGVFRCGKQSCSDACDEAPVMFDYLCQGCNAYIQHVLEYLERHGVQYLPNPYLTGDFNYYNRMIFAFTATADLQSVRPRRPDDTDVLASGGRCDYLIERLGGRQLPAVGGSLILERVIEALPLPVASPPGKRTVFFIAVGDEARKAGATLMSELRHNQFVVLEAMGKRTLQSQLKAAEKSGARVALIYGQREVFEGVIILREPASNTQRSVPVERFLEEVRRQLTAAGRTAA